MTANILLFGFVFTLIYMSILFSQTLSKKNTFFGVFIEEKDKKAKDLLQFKQHFQIRITIIYILSLASLLFYFSINENSLLLLLHIFLSLILYFFIYLRTHQQIKRYKDQHFSTEIANKKVIINPTFIEERNKWKTIFTLLSCIPLLIACFSCLTLIVHYPSLPNEIPMHFNIAGEVDHYAQKSVLSVFQISFLHFLISILFLFITRWSFQSRVQLDLEHIEQSTTDAMRYLKLVGLNFFILNLLISVLFGIFPYSILTGHIPSAKIMMILIVLLFVNVGSLIAVYAHYGQRKFLSTPESRTYSLEDEDRYWLWGVFYNNPDDPAIMVQKRFGVGWTINIGHSTGKIILIGTLIFTFLAIFMGFLANK